MLLKPDPKRRIGWRARYADPDSGRTVKETLDLGLRTTELREDWAVRKSKALALRRLALEGGAARTTGTALADAIDRYYRDHPQLRERTREIYKHATDKLAAWCARHAVASADDLTGPKLVAFRASLVRAPVRKHAAGGKRGALEETTRPRAPATVNQELRAIGTALGYLRAAGLLPRLDSDALRDALKKLPVSRDRVDFRKPHELQALLDAASRHDADTFAATRDEHAGKGAPGSTPRHKPIAPLVAAAVLTGM
ncbi:MAG TPA: hypothetical protein VFV94_12615, partial [Polyangiaceae bacterium]|nr:hypothetical protein [Polyangiaceae bacterium]